MNFRDPQTIIEQIGLLIASLIWTMTVLVAVILFWVYQDTQARWDYIVNAPPEALAQELPAATATPTPTVWAGPGPTLTPTPTQPPTATPTRVIPLPEVLPETLNPDDPTPVPVIVHTEDEAAEYGVDQPAAPAPVEINILPTATPVPPPPVIDDPPAPSNPASAGSPPTRLTINSIGLDSEVTPVGWSIVQKDGFEYSIWQVADYAVGWHKTTAPLGQPGNTVMAGHHNVNGEVFRDLVNVEVGDRVEIYSGNQKFDYVVDLKTIVKEKGEPIEVRKRNAEWIAPTDDERITMVTCWPYTNNTHRVIVVARPA